MTETWARDARGHARAEHGEELRAALRLAHRAVPGALKLSELTPEVIARWQAERIAAGAGRVSVLQGADAARQRSCSGRWSPSGSRATRCGWCARSRRPPKREVRPLAPATVEAMRAASDARDATLISVLAYAGLRPQEALALRWRDVGERTLMVNAPKTGPAAQRAAAGAAASRTSRPGGGAQGTPDEDALVFPGHDGERWALGGVQELGAQAPRGPQAPGQSTRGGQPGPVRPGGDQRPACRTATPYTLRHSFCSLLLHEGRSVIYVARQLGHDAKLTLSTYGHVIDELEDAPRMPAEDAIRAAAWPVCHWCVTGGGAMTCARRPENDENPRAVRGFS